MESREEAWGAHSRVIGTAPAWLTAGISRKRVCVEGRDYAAREAPIAGG